MSMYRQALVNNHINNHKPVGVILTSNHHDLEQIKHWSSVYRFDYVVCFYDGVYFIFYFNGSEFYTYEYFVRCVMGLWGVTFYS